jgi:multiple sugar transport system substrate-binding protein
VNSTDTHITLKGIGWDHPRCMEPLYASISAYKKPNITIEWSARSLYAFGEGRLAELIDNYDLIIFDHPYVGEISKNGTFLNLRDFLSDTQINQFSADSSGPSWQSYQFDGGIWGLPIDAATQVSAYRDDLLAQNDVIAPSRLDDVFELASLLKKRDLWIAIPLNTVDSFCALLTLTAHMGSPLNQQQPLFFDIPILKEALKTIRMLADIAHPDSTFWNPITCFNHMRETNEIAYVPYAFGYTNYSRDEHKNRISFCDIPAIGEQGPTGALLGGAGIGISKNCENPEMAMEYATFLCSSEFQSGDYFNAGGQPASLAAWELPANNDKANGFFSGTTQSMKNSYMRPRYHGIIPFIRQSAPLVHTFVRGELSLVQTVEKLQIEFDRMIKQ